MTTPTSPDPVAGTAGRSRRTRTTLLALGLVAAVVLLGGGAALARAVADDPGTAAQLPDAVDETLDQAGGTSGAADGLAPVPDNFAAPGGDTGTTPGAGGAPPGGTAPDGTLPGGAMPDAAVPDGGLPPGGPGGGGRRFVDGTVAAVHPDTLTVTLTDGSSTDYAVDSTTRVVLDGDQVEVDELPAGESVLVHAEQTDETVALAEVVLAGDVSEMPMGPGGIGGPGGGGGAAGSPPAREGDAATTPEPTTATQTV